jgi:NhaP-type Na+/H+ or K+/H+ antiporter
VAFFGIRGIGSFYYVAYAVTAADFPGQDLVWATTAAVVIASVVIHGVAATPVMRRIDRSRDTDRSPHTDRSQHNHGPQHTDRSTKDAR